MYLRSIIVLNLLSLLFSSHAITIEGQFDTGEFFHFLQKFGFIKSEKTTAENFGYIYGNITSSDGFLGHSTLAVLDRHHFLEFYGNR